MMKKIGIIGAGSWGTALAIVLRRAGCEVMLWARDQNIVDTIQKTGVNLKYLSHSPLDSIKVTSKLDNLQSYKILLLVVPAQSVRETCQKLAKHLSSNTILILCSKGIEIKTARLMTQVVQEELPKVKLCVLSGPNFASEVALGMPTAVTLACKDHLLGKEIIEIIGSTHFRPYFSDDVIGVELGGAVKNILAIASGIIEGKGYGHNARAALITRGIAELVRLSLAYGGRAETAMGLSGLGDLILTASSEKSRNYSLGVLLGRGEQLKDILADSQKIVEGVSTALAVFQLAHSKKVEMPICSTITDLLYHGLDLDEAITGLLSRPFKAEFLGD
jgi:glycerol-3-phosphate dehydrogenase (NAD(P)+)